MYSRPTPAPSPRRVATGLLAVCCLGPLLTACGSRAPLPSSTQVAPKATTTTSLPPSSSSSPPSSSPPANPPLVDWGARPSQWAANHHPDPLTGPGNWWPRYANGLDEYTKVSLSGPRVVSYTLNLYPPMGFSVALARVRDELPPASTVLRAEPVPPAAPTCEAVVLRDPLLERKVHSDVMAVMHSAASAWNPASVSSVSLSPYPVSGGPALSCG